MKPINMAQEWQITAKRWAAIAQERREKIEQALQVLREGLAALQPGDAYLYADYARQAVQILEPTP